MCHVFHFCSASLCSPRTAACPQFSHRIARSGFLSESSLIEQIAPVSEQSKLQPTMKPPAPAPCAATTSQWQSKARATASGRPRPSQGIPNVLTGAG